MEPEDGTSTIIFVLASLVFLGSAGAAAYKYHSYQKEKDLIDAKVIREKHKEYESGTVKFKNIEMLDFD